MVGRRWKALRCLVWQLLVTVTLPTASRAIKSSPTVVPGSDHIVVQTEFPYEFWRATGRVFTAAPQSPDHSDYGYYYGEVRVGNNPDNWKIMPIQIPNDLVGNVSQQVVPASARVPTYPTSATPQYGRHPGATEAHHLFHPERFYEGLTDNSNQGYQGSLSHSVPRQPEHQYKNWTSSGSGPPNPSQDDHNFHSPETYQQGYPSTYDIPQIPRPPQYSNWDKKPVEASSSSSSWHNSLMETLEPLLDSSLAKLPSLPKFPALSSITRLSSLPVWPFNMRQDGQGEQQGHGQGVMSEPGETGQVVHQFYPILSDAHPHHRWTNNRRNNKIPHYFHVSRVGYKHRGTQKYPANHFMGSKGTDRHTLNQFSQSNEEESSYLSYDPVPQPLPADTHAQGTSDQDHHVHVDPHTGGQDLPLKNGPPYLNFLYSNEQVRRPNHNRKRPFRKNKDPINSLHNMQWDSNEGAGGHRQPGSHRRPWRPSQRPTDLYQQRWDQYHNVEKQMHQPHQAQPWPAVPTNHITTYDTHYQTQNRDSHSFSSFQSHRRPHLDSKRPPFSDLHQAQSQESHSLNLNPFNWVYHHHWPSYSDSNSEHGIIERLTGVDSLTPSVVVPGGMLTLGLALAIYYFNYIWYPTPVVTAKLGKILSDSVADNSLSVNQQRAISEVYQVFRSLEDTHSGDLWSFSCKSQLVCQVHHKLPGLFRVTKAYGAIVRSLVVPGPDGDNEVNKYLRAGQLGSEGATCHDHYPACPLP